jgi:hypothetical protein
MRSRLRAASISFTLLACLGTQRNASAQPVGNEFRVNTYTTNDQTRPRVSVGGTGGLVVVWQSQYQDGSEGGIFGQRYDGTGGALGGEFQVNSTTAGEQVFPAVSFGSSNFVVAWFATSPNGIFARRFATSGAALGLDFRVSTYTTNNQFPAVATQQDGSFVVVWQTAFGPGNTGVFGARYGSTGDPLGGEFRISRVTTSFQGYPAVTSDGSGGFVVAWFGNAPDNGGVDLFARRYASDGSPAAPEFRVNNETSSTQRSASIAAAPNGDFVVAWQSYQQDGSQNGVFCRRYASSGAPLGLEFQVNTTTSLSQHDPSVASDGAGFVVVWQSEGQDGDGGGSFGQRFDSAGNTLGAEFRLNSFTTSDQSLPNVAKKPNGDFVVVWQSPQDASGQGVFGQGFCAALSSVSVSAMGSTSVCATTTGGTLTVSDTGGVSTTHQWGYRLVSGGPFLTMIAGETGATYVVDGSDFPAAGTYYVVCVTFPSCGTFMISNEVTVIVTADASGPVVTPPTATTTTQTLCQ